MRKVMFAAALAASVFGVSTASFAKGHAMAAFGPVVEMEMKSGELKGHMMHLQVIENDDGDKFVVMPMEEAEALLGPITAPAMHYAGR